MRKTRLLVAPLLAAVLCLIALPTAANAQSTRAAATQSGPCTGLGIDIALGSVNFCIPL